MSWLLLVLAGVFEVVWAIALKYSNGFTNIKASVIVIIGMIVSIYFLALAMKQIPISIAYPVWTSVGALGTATFGMMFLGDSVSLTKTFFLSLILVGVVGLKAVS